MFTTFLIILAGIIWTPYTMLVGAVITIWLFALLICAFCLLMAIPAIFLYQTIKAIIKINN